MPDNLVEAVLTITAEATAVHPANVVLDEHGDPVLDRDGNPILKDEL